MVRIGKFRVKIPDNTTTGFRDFKAEVVLPDNVHIIAMLRSTPFEVINIGRTTYIKRGTGWLTSTSAGGTSVAEMAGFMREEGIRDITNVVALGADSVDGAPTKVYAFDSVYPLVTGPQQYHVKAWISDASNTIVKSESTNAAGVTSTTRMEMDPTITVVAPI